MSVEEQAAVAGRVRDKEFVQRQLIWRPPFIVIESMWPDGSD